ncbi:hypothetical protein SAMN05216359_105324 [Roseateles sp. YR242]|uniref:hypothetical protein n=1 Tax=Roseateles sp. YR242 TaxID=1855305 RepID=UPI0008BAB957|nr:hypothetical protein [Roseateles sp. YR242]SEL13484.1 hypothetical protein SAMN05216359_105324 [Roseateles sp. YR242]
MSDLIVRCSSIGRLMAKPENADLDPLYLTPEVKAVIAKTKRTDEEKALLEHARRHSLSAGGKTHVRELVREAIYGFEPADIETRPILKGRAVEEECIALLARLTGRPLVKNGERRNNGLISGECDIFDAPLGHGRDIKAPYSMESMPIVLADCYDSGYEWQMRGYMALWDAETWSVDYVLVSTPEEYIGLEPQHLHFVDHIAERHRWTTWTVMRDRALEALIQDKVQAARRYYRQVVDEFDRAHADPAELAAMAAAGHPAPWEEPKAPAAPATPIRAPKPVAEALASLDDF